MDKAHKFILDSLDQEEKFFTDNYAVGKVLFKKNEKVRELVNQLFIIKGNIQGALDSVKSVTPEIYALQSTLKIFDHFEDKLENKSNVY